MHYGDEVSNECVCMSQSFISSFLCISLCIKGSYCVFYDKQYQYISSRLFNTSTSEDIKPGSIYMSCPTVWTRHRVSYCPKPWKERVVCVQLRSLFFASEIDSLQKIKLSELRETIMVISQAIRDGPRLVMPSLEEVLQIANSKN